MVLIESNIVLLQISLTLADKKILFKSF